jgi:hypothetical protein
MFIKMMSQDKNTMKCQPRNNNGFIFFQAITYIGSDQKFLPELFIPEEI